MRTVKLICAGDSITLGAYLGAGETYPELVEAALALAGADVDMVNIGVGSTTLDDGFDTAAIAEIDPAKDLNIVTVLFGANDMHLGQSAVDFEANLKSKCQGLQAAGLTVVVLTTLPHNASGGFNAKRNAANALTRADLSFYSARADVGGDPTIGADAAPGDTNLFTDGVHPTALGMTYLEPHVTEAILSLLSTVRFGSVFGGLVRCDS